MMFPLTVNPNDTRSSYPTPVHHHQHKINLVSTPGKKTKEIPPTELNQINDQENKNKTNIMDVNKSSLVEPSFPPRVQKSFKPIANCTRQQLKIKSNIRSVSPFVPGETSIIVKNIPSDSNTSGIRKRKKINITSNIRQTQNVQEVADEEIP